MVLTGPLGEQSVRTDNMQLSTIRISSGSSLIDRTNKDGPYILDPYRENMQLRTDKGVHAA
jgi:hypothetical protein